MQSQTASRGDPPGELPVPSGACLFQSGIVLEEDKHYLFESRLAPIVRQLGLGSINDLCALLRATRETRGRPPGGRGHDDQRNLFLPRSRPL